MYKIQVQMLPQINMNIENQGKASQYNGNEQYGDAPYNIGMCCHNKFRDCKCLKFLKHNYDFSKSVLERAFHLDLESMIWLSLFVI